MTRHHLAASALLVLATLVTPAGFAGVDDTPSVVVRTDDLNLGAERGVRILYQRLKFAAADVCPADGRDSTRATRARNCRTAVLDRTIAQAALPELTALHRERSGAPSRLASR